MAERLVERRGTDTLNPVLSLIGLKLLEDFAYVKRKCKARRETEFCRKNSVSVSRFLYMRGKILHRVITSLFVPYQHISQIWIIGVTDRYSE